MYINTYMYIYIWIYIYIYLHSHIYIWYQCILINPTYNHSFKTPLGWLVNISFLDAEKRVVFVNRHLCTYMDSEGKVRVCCLLQCVAVCCSVLQCVAVCCSVLQCVAVCCSVWVIFVNRHLCTYMDSEGKVRVCCLLQRVAACCSVLQCVSYFRQPPPCCIVLQCVALCCSVVVSCSVLQRVAVCELFLFLSTATFVHT